MIETIFLSIMGVLYIGFQGMFIIMSIMTYKE